MVPSPGKDGKWLRNDILAWEGQAIPELDAIMAKPSFVARPRGTRLYRHFDEAGTLLYVGISLSALNRLADHKEDSAWYWSVAKVTIDVFPTRQEAEAAERRAIRTEMPIFNRMHGDKAKCDMARDML